MKVSVYAPLLSRLLAGPRPYVGTLVGLVHDDRAHVLGCLLDHVEGGTPGVGSELLDALPGGLAPLGVAGDSDGRLEELALLSTVISLLPAGAQRAVVLSVSGGEGEGEPEPTAALFLYGDGELERTEFETFGAEQLRAQTVLLRLEGALSLRCKPGCEPLAEAFDRLKRTLDSPVTCFVQPEANRLLRAQDDESAPEGSCSELAGRRSAGRAQALFKLMLQRTGLVESRPAGGAPVIEYCRGRQQLVDLTLPISCVALVAAAAPLAQAAAALSEAALRQLAQLRTVITDVYREKERVVPAEPLHFNPEECGHYVTLVYSAASDDEKLESYRRNVHAALLLAADRPLFRRANRHRFDDQSPFLTNVHVGLSAPRQTAGQTALVRGTYVYHHYMQDRMDDSGWGCAYRSLQTLASWFQRQGYTGRAPPTHREIQQCLVDIGDKPASFVGSRQWIGSTEVSYCLQHLYGVESRILHVSSGADLGSKARALLRHFNDEGTPVMIGGGVLAHTLLGVAFDEASGEASFLVLDPHYTGAENLTTIQNKGWCGWKDGQFWDQTAYYNLCMPVRPRCV
ncbi:Ufm1-specific protease 2 [Amphibalanus amphitrite]|uniref:Probable Ufm1-specific protease 2 n=1 Tax=Amphibalanus amphitrite TaxID=1232801 RepID=A0A6A4VC71_AMPAM|nr:Ufm1-specific protease 2 [Amphibalanus amphitrite]